MMSGVSEWAKPRQTGKKPAEDGKPGHEEPKEKEKKKKKKKRAEAAGPRWQVSTTEDWSRKLARGTSGEVHYIFRRGPCPWQPDASGYQFF
jgi:hypothetical protein